MINCCFKNKKNWIYIHYLHKYPYSDNVTREPLH